MIQYNRNGKPCLLRSAWRLFITNCRKLPQSNMYLAFVAIHRCFFFIGSSSYSLSILYISHGLRATTCLYHFKSSHVSRKHTWHVQHNCILISMHLTNCPYILYHIAIRYTQFQIRKSRFQLAR